MIGKRITESAGCGRWHSRLQWVGRHGSLHGAAVHRGANDRGAIYGSNSANHQDPVGISSALLRIMMASGPNGNFSMLRKLVAIIVIATVVIAGGTYAAFKLSPWPSVLLIRNGFGNMDEEVVSSVAPFVPKGISAQQGLNYAPGERDTLFDIFAPAGAKAPLPAVIWVHGGGFVAGSRSGLD